MIEAKLVIELTIAYLATLFAVAYFVEWKFKKGTNLANNAIVYTLSLAIYCTAWTFYGNVGLAATNGFLFLGVYIGPTLFFIFWWKVLRRLVKIRNEYNITSIADFISVRYGKSSVVAAIVSLIALVGIVPYLSLQLKAIFNSYSIITTGSNSVSGLVNPVDLAVLGVIIFFVIIFGLRNIDQSERHPGMVMAIAIQSIVKLIAFVCVGVFATYFLHKGFGDVFSQVVNSNLLSAQKTNFPSYSLFMAYTVLSFSAILFLPRQFHMAVVENTDEKHIKTAVWLLPLYFIAITIFVFPIAMSGILKGFDISNADSFILLLPLQYGSAWLSILVFLGGLSAAISMLMISSMTITTMTSNYLLLPLLGKLRMSGFFYRHLLPLRWFLVVVIMFVAYAFEIKIGSSYVLVKIGMISFAAALQFAPAAIGGLFWEKGSKVGAILGLSSGFLVWGYASLIPAFVRSGWMGDGILQSGPFGLNFLRPEHLFGATSLDPLAQIVLFTMLFNVGFYVIGSLVWRRGEAEKQNTNEFFGVMDNYGSLSQSTYWQSHQIGLAGKIKIINSIFEKYLSNSEAKKATQDCLEKAGVAEKKEILINELIALNNIVEKTLSSYVGAPSAGEDLSKNSLFDTEESEYLSDIYAKMATDLKLTPSEFAEKISYYQEKEKFIAEHQTELENLVKERTGALEEKMTELTQWQRATINRELKMIELKEEINKLKQK